MLRKAVGAIVDASGRRPLVVLALALCALIGTWHFALKVLTHPHTDLRELLPSDSPGLKAFEHQLGRVGGGASLLVLVESANRPANQRFVDDLSVRLDAMAGDQKTRGQELIAHVEYGTKDVRRFFEDNKWLYAEQKDLDGAYDTLDFQIAIQSGLVSNLDEDDESPRAPSSTEGSQSPAKKPALGLDEYRDRWNAKAKSRDDFPSGYFETEDGKMFGVRIVSRTSGLGDAGGELLLRSVEGLIRDMRPVTYDPSMRVGFAGDIPNAVAEKDSVVSEAAWASALALLLIVAAVVWFYRSAWSLAIIALPAILGVGGAYAFAYLRFGYVNTTGMFLGAIILGNGINYPIVLLSRYREFRSRGQDPAAARREAVQNALRAELVGACVASIAYGSLTITHFRGFSQFGWIGFVGMLLVWGAMIPCVPALIVVVEWVQSKLGMRTDLGMASSRASRGSIMRAVARLTERAPLSVAAIAVVLMAAAAWRLPGFLRDPWEYNFDRLGSRGSKQGGAGEWSNKAEKVFGGKMNVAGALMLADAPEQVPALKAQIVANDSADRQGRLIADIATVYDLLPGSPDEQGRKLETLDRIRERLTPAVVDSLPPEERARVEELRPPDSLRVLGPSDLPALLRRRFEENDGRVGTVFYVKYKNDVVLSEGHNLLRIAKSTDNVKLADGT
ncbi:MAG TPA: MMPL family transporter, partial [Polyangiaceae bacterium]|nr:MMPL family transporter [Polyangiaceae bacterium]